ncbi:FliH/SctL family protein [Anaerotignum sp.]|uniref:FliH/SctL family protein n=1 Tax=Anaerotignum sp. TaxID=2039241 RepID=UPI003322CAE7
MILLHKEGSTVGSFAFAQFGADVEEKSHSCEAGCEIVLPEFETEVLIEAEKEEPEEEFPTELLEDKLLLKEMEKREEELREKEKRIIHEARRKAEDILKEALDDAEEIRVNAFDQASREGYQDGFEKAYAEHKAKMDEDTAIFLIKVRDIIQTFEAEKEALISQNIDELKELVLVIAEKVIQVSLKTSGEIIKKMIVTATNKMKYKEWAKIYISKSDSSLIIESNADLLDAISHLSEHIKVVVMEDSAPGTCIIELPDQIIDASANTQLENIRGIMKSVGTLGGNNIV